MKSNSVFLSNLHYFYAQTDGTYAIPNNTEGRLLKTAKKEIEALEHFRQDINKLLDKVVELEKENYRLNQLINGKNARRSMEEHISNEIVDGTYDPWPTDFDYETDFHHKLSTLMKQVDKLRAELAAVKINYAQDKENYQCATKAGMAVEAKLREEVAELKSKINK